jgi:hypothetical protein
MVIACPERTLGKSAGSQHVAVATNGTAKSRPYFFAQLFLHSLRIYWTAHIAILVGAA